LRAMQVGLRGGWQRAGHGDAVDGGVDVAVGRKRAGTGWSCPSW
jgi:hypothetical protein